MIARNILDLIGNTPMVQINHLNQNPNLEIYIKLEKFNPGGASKTA
jgi:cysteine synthase